MHQTFYSFTLFCHIALYAEVTPSASAEHVWLQSTIYKNMLHVFLLWSPMWSSGQSSWQQIQRSRFDSQHYQIFLRSSGSGTGVRPLSLVSVIEELLGRKGSGSGLENWEYGYRDPTRWPRGTLYPEKLSLTSPVPVGIVRWKTQTTEFFYYLS
jgi:hypothetical protein